MSLPEIPEGWEKCEVGEAERLLLPTGLLCDFDRKGLYVNIHYENSHAAEAIITMARNDLVAAFGITPVRKVEPIEFTVTATIDAGQGAGAVWVSILVDNKLVGKTFREVIE